MNERIKFDLSFKDSSSYCTTISGWFSNAEEAYEFAVLYRKMLDKDPDKFRLYEIKAGF